MNRSIRAVLLLAMACCVSPVLANPADETVTVVGTIPSPAQARQRAADLVRKLGLQQGDRPVARWIDPVCPHVLDLPPDMARLVERRIRDVAVAVHAPVASPPCRTNIVVGFAADGASLTREIARRSPRSVSEVDAVHRAALLGGTAPVRWWYATAATGSDGDRLANDAPPGASGHNPGENAADVPVGSEGAFSAYNSSLVSTHTVRVIRQATVIVDVPGTTGKTLNAVADYAALVALAELHPPEAAPGGSVLGLFTATPEPIGLTRADRALLGALYAMPLNRLAQQQRGQLIVYTADRLRGRQHP